MKFKCTKVEVSIYEEMKIGAVELINQPDKSSTNISHIVLRDVDTSYFSVGNQYEVTFKYIGDSP